MTPSPEQIAHYRILAKLGEGGMGQVFRARDERLGRDVAIKVLPPALSNDAQYMARFEREAQTLAALNHPNIAAIYGIEQGAIVMELVEGESLPCPVPLDTALNYARQIAEGLEAAHEKGIVHRDLKPANIRVTPDGRVKILDFGLAKSGGDALRTASASVSPTLSLAMTQAGMILGTAAYMAPEQARGKPVDKRADVWAYGVVLYEMLTGRQLFGGGETVTDTLASVVKDAPNLSALPAGTAPHIRRLLDRCLQKDPLKRLRDIGEARITIEEAPSEPAPPASAGKARGSPWVIATAGLLLAAIGIGAWVTRRPIATPAAQARFVLPLPEGQTRPPAPAARQAAPSPDGSQIAFVAADAAGRTWLWVRGTNEIASRRLDRTEGAKYPFWSPDSQSIAFFTDDKLKRIATSGASLQTICDARPGDNSGANTSSLSGTWGSDGTIVFATGGGDLLRAPATGGSSVTWNGPPANVDLVRSSPQFLPDGRHILYFAAEREPESGAMYVQQAGASRVMVLKTRAAALWAAPGYLLFVREGALFAQQMDPTSWQLTGEPQTVAEEVAFNDLFHRSSMAASDNGVLVYRRGSRDNGLRQFAWRDRAGKTLSAIGQPGRFGNIALAPDEKHVAMLLNSDLWTMDLSTGVQERVTFSGHASLNMGLWSPDSRRIILNLREGGVQVVTVADKTLQDLTSEPLECHSWLPDGQSLVCVNARDALKTYLLPVTPQAKPQVLRSDPRKLSSFRVAPDGKFVAYTSDESGAVELHVATFPKFEQRRQVTNGGASYPSWSGDGRELFYRRPATTIMSVSFRGGGSLEVGAPKPLFDYGTVGAGNRFAVSSDGQRLLIMEPVEKDTTPPDVIVTVNWAAGLKQ